MSDKNPIVQKASAIAQSQAIDNEQLAAEFIQFVLAKGALKFGEFTLKSGRVSPYFFNAGAFTHGADLVALGRFYAQALVNAGLEFDLLFGPAYKGIPLATATALTLAQTHNRNVPYCFNRKEAKEHGEGGQLVGAPLAGKCLIIDDVITAGTAIREAIGIISAQAQPAGVVIALDRQERGLGRLSAIEEIQTNYNIPVVSIINLDALVAFVKDAENYRQWYPAVAAYREQYGVAN